jgi:hypothetical protein
MRLRWKGQVPEESHEVVDSLHDLGVKVAMITGDAHQGRGNVAEELFSRVCGRRHQYLVAVSVGNHNPGRLQGSRLRCCVAMRSCQRLPRRVARQ